MAIQALKGFKDILPDEIHRWLHIEQVAREVFRRFGFAELRVPILEKTELFVRSIGEATDIVEKEMYTFTDKSGELVTMRPEGTAPVLRAFVENGLHAKHPVTKIFTIGPMFRHERPQKGRLRQFHQLSAEVLGASEPRLDAEVMAAAWTIINELGLSASLEINSLGCPVCRPVFREKLTSFLADLAGLLCEDCERRRVTNPLRVLDCKSVHCQEYYRAAPSILEKLCPDCAEHFQATRTAMDSLEIPYRINSFMVRGLDYYTRTTFELVTGALGAQSAVGAGGRYDGLVEQLGGPALPGIGFGMGMERLALLLEQKGEVLVPSATDLFLAALGEQAREKVFVLAHRLRQAGLAVVFDHEGRSLKSQMKHAGRTGARFALILGDDEMAKGVAPLRDMESGEQREVVLDEESIREAMGL